MKGERSRQEKTKHKRNTLPKAVNYIYVFISLCCGHQMKMRSPLIKYVIKSECSTESVSTFMLPPLGL